MAATHGEVLSASFFEDCEKLGLTVRLPDPVSLGSETWETPSPPAANGCEFKEGRHLMVQITTTTHGTLDRSKRRMAVRGLACLLAVAALVTVVSVLFRSDSVEAQTTCTSREAAAEAVRLQGGYVLRVRF